MTPVAFMQWLAEFRAPSWDGWRGILARLVPSVREFFVIAGRGSGKSRIVALLACAYATREYARAPGENIYIGVAAPDRRQAALTFRYVAGLLRSVSELAALIVEERAESVELSNGVIVEVVTASTAAPRGRAYALFIVEESAFLATDTSAADPDVELLRAVRPALARVPGSLLAVIGSPYKRGGVLFEAWQAGDAADRIVITADTASLNPTFDAGEIARAFRDDPTSARAEYGTGGVIEFRSDVSTLLVDAALAAVVLGGVREFAPEPGRGYVAHLDAATGSGDDSAGLAIAYHDGTRAVLAAVRQWRPPFSPETMAKDAARLLRSYGLSASTIDRFAPGLVADLLRREGISARAAGRDTSTAFHDLLVAINSDRCRLLDDAVLLKELSRLERRPGVSGRDFIGHPPRGHDDVAAAVAFAITNVAKAEARGSFGLLFEDTDEREVARLQGEVERLGRELAGRVQSAVATVRAAASRTVSRLRLEQRSPQEQAARRRQADRLKRERREQQREAREQATAERHRELHALAAERHRQAAVARGQLAIMKSIKRRGWWWPGE